MTLKRRAVLKELKIEKNRILIESTWIPPETIGLPAQIPDNDHGSDQMNKIEYQRFCGVSIFENQVIIHWETEHKHQETGERNGRIQQHELIHNAWFLQINQM